MSSMSEKNLVPISQAAKLLGVSIQTLRRWNKAGSLRPAFVSPGGHRYYAKSDLEQYLQDLFVLAKAWAVSQSATSLSSDMYCQTSSIFQARLSSFEIAVRKIPDLHVGERFSLVVAIVGEIGDNAFAHNLGNWPDIPGVFFAYDVHRRYVVLADRGVGVLATLRHVKPGLRDDPEALTVAFTERISGRTPENRGNGLKFVRQIIAENDFRLMFQSGNALLTLQGGSQTIHMASADLPLRGTLVVLNF